MSMLKYLFIKFFNGAIHGCDRDRISVDSSYSKWHKLFKRIMERREELITLLSTTAIITNKLGYYDLADAIIVAVIVLEILAFFNRGGERYIHRIIRLRGFFP